MEVFTPDKIKKCEIFFLSPPSCLWSSTTPFSSELLPLVSNHTSFSDTISLLQASPFGLRPPLFLRHHLFPPSFSLLWSRTDMMYSLLEDDSGGGGGGRIPHGS
ncbi:hypothetical protein AAZX31_05G226000 [Glycine max]